MREITKAAAEQEIRRLKEERVVLQAQVHELNYKIVELNHLIYQEEQKHEH